MKPNKIYENLKFLPMVEPGRSRRRRKMVSKALNTAQINDVLMDVHVRAVKVHTFFLINGKVKIKLLSRCNYRHIDGKAGMGKAVFARKDKKPYGASSQLKNL